MSQTTILPKIRLYCDRLCAFDHCRVPLPWFVWNNRQDSVSRLHQQILSLDYGSPNDAIGIVRRTLAAALHFIRGTREIIMAWKRFHQACTTGYQIPPLRQLRQLGIAVFRHNIPPKAYYLTRLFRLDRSRWNSIFSHGETTLLLSAFERRITFPQDPWSKAGWSVFAQKAGIPTIPVIAEAVDGTLHLKDSHTLKTGEDYFLKPNIDFSSQGGVMLLWDKQNDAWRAQGAVTRSIPSDGLPDFLRSHSRHKHLIVQPRMQNAESLADITKHALLNTRIVTMSSPQHGITILMAAMRCPPHDEVTSDVLGSTLSVRIDPESGRFCSAESAILSKGLCPNHPVTHAPFEGRLIKEWPIMRDLALAAHQHMPAMPTVGWDLIVTRSGVYILEANSVWNALLTQHWGLEPLGETLWPEVMLSHLGSSTGIANSKESKNRRSAS